VWLVNLLTFAVGCGLAWAVDGNWKLTFPVCMFPIRDTQPGMHGLNAPNVCPDQPSGNAILCKEHLALAQQRGYPITVKAFLCYCGAQKTAGNNFAIQFVLVQCIYLYVSLTETATDDEHFDVHDEDSTALEKTLEKIAVQGPADGVARAQGE